MVFAAVEDVAKAVTECKAQCAAMETKMNKFSKAPAAGTIPKVSEFSNIKDDVSALDTKLNILKSLRK